jgi:transposase-like protein
MEESLAPAASVVEVARRHNLLTVWRRQARSGAFGPGPAPRQDDEIHFCCGSPLRQSNTL